MRNSTQVFLGTRYVRTEAQEGVPSVWLTLFLEHLQHYRPVLAITVHKFLPRKAAVREIPSTQLCEQHRPDCTNGNTRSLKNKLNKHVVPEKTNKIKCRRRTRHSSEAGFLFFVLPPIFLLSTHAAIRILAADAVHAQHRLQRKEQEISRY